MIRRRKIVLGGLLLLVGGAFACGPVHQTLYPDGYNLVNLKKLAIVIPAEGDFTVIYERDKATWTPFIMFGFIGAAVARAHNKSLDEELAKSIGNNLDGFSCRSVFKDSLRKSLYDSGIFSDIQVFDRDLDLGEVSRYDAVLTFRIPSWGIRIVERGETEQMAAFVELEAKMVQASTSHILRDKHDTVIGQSKRTLDSYQNEKELSKKDIHETIEDAGQRMANILIYQRDYAFYKNRPEKLPVEIGLFLSDKEKNYVLRAPTTEYKIGNALEVEAIASLKKVFPNISIVNNKEGVSADTDRIIAIKFGPEANVSSWETGEVKVFGGSVSNFMARVELICEVYDKNWNLLWKKSLVGEYNLERELPTTVPGLLFGVLGILFEETSEYQRAKITEQARRDVIIGSLFSALEQLNDEILTSGKQPILRGK